MASREIALFVGLLLWLFLMIRVLRPALRKEGEQKQLVALLAVATGAIALFYGAGLTWGQHTHLSMVEYWRWWVVHLWVEGFFEVFAITVNTTPLHGHAALFGVYGMLGIARIVLGMTK